MKDGDPSVARMIAFVAIAVALEIVVFFALGYVLGRIFL